jgi:hypothetical protein
VADIKRGDIRMAGRRRRLLAILATIAVLGPLGWLWQASLLPGTYSIMDMGTPTMAAVRTTRCPRRVAASHR